MRKAVANIGKSHDWKKVSQVKVGDYIHWAGDDFKVVRLDQPNKYTYRITVFIAGEEQEYQFENTSEVLVKK